MHDPKDRHMSWCLIEKTERVAVTVQSNLAAWEDAEGIW